MNADISLFLTDVEYWGESFSQQKLGESRYFIVNDQGIHKKIKAYKLMVLEIIVQKLSYILVAWDFLTW